MTLALMRREQERRYWQDLLTRMTRLTAAARVAEVDPDTAQRALKRCGLNRRSITPPNPPLTRFELGRTFRDFMLRGEHVYWMRMCAEHRDGTQLAAAAGISRTSVYRRIAASGLSLRLIRKMQGRKLEHGNDAWRSLSDDSNHAQRLTAHQ